MRLANNKETHSDNRVGFLIQMKCLAKLREFFSKLQD